MNLRNKLPFYLSYIEKFKRPTFLEYVEFDGKSYIDTLINEKGGTWTVTASGNNETQLRFLIGDGGQASQYFGVLSNGKWGMGVNSEDYYFENARTDKITAEVIFVDKLATVIIDGITKTREGTLIANDNFLLCGYRDSVNYYFKGKVYNCSYTNINGELVLDLRPALDPNGVVCMYDTVTKKYFYNAGTGELKAGGRFVESIVFDGACVIDTGITHQTCKIECDIRFEETGARQLMGFGTGSGQYWGASPAGIFDYMSGTNALDRTDVVIDFNAEQINYTIYADSKSRTSANGDALSPYAYRIGAGPTGKDSNSYWCTCEVWSNKTYIGGELVQDLRPYVDSNGVACFKDVVTDTLFYNKGTGTLTYTEYEELEYLEFDGIKYIDTGYKPNSNSSVSCTYYPYYNTKFFCVFGTQNDATTGRFYAVVSSTLYRLQLNSGDISVFYGVDPTGLRLSNNGSFASEQQKVSLTIDNYNKQIKVASDELTNTYDMTQYSYNGNNLGEVECHYNLLIGNRNNSGVISSSNVFKGQISSFEIKENGKLVRDMIPVKRSDGTVCMYDKVENKYYELISV